MLHRGRTEPKYGQAVMTFVAGPCQHDRVQQTTRWQVESVITRSDVLTQKMTKGLTFPDERRRSIVSVAPAHEASRGMGKTASPASFCRCLSTPPHSNCYSTCPEVSPTPHMRRTLIISLRKRELSGDTRTTTQKTTADGCLLSRALWARSPPVALPAARTRRIGVG